MPKNQDTHVKLAAKLISFEDNNVVHSFFNSKKK